MADGPCARRISFSKMSLSQVEGMRARPIVQVIILGCFATGCGAHSERSAPSTGDSAAIPTSPTSLATAGSAGGDTNTDQVKAWALESAPADWRTSPSPDIPIVAGLTEVVAVQESRGDYESLASVESVTSSAVTYSFSVRSGSVNGMASNRARRVVPRRDMEVARGYRMTFSSADAESFPGQTAVGISAALYRELHDRGQSRLDLYASTDVVAAVASILSTLGAEGSDLSGELTRVEPEPVGVPVLVNGRRVWLPALHAKGEFQRIDRAVVVEFWFFADPRNPITLRAAVDSARLQVVRIDFPAEEAARTLERALAEREPVEMWGVYFEFGSARLTPESMTVIDNVASVLRRHPDWRIRIDGHTDNVGSEADNLRLSQQRADAVRAELARRVGDDGSRLTVAGYGAAQPREPNTTLSGRARNRRVELVRQ